MWTYFVYSAHGRYVGKLFTPCELSTKEQLSAAKVLYPYNRCPMVGLGKAPKPVEV